MRLLLLSHLRELLMLPAIILRLPVLSNESHRPFTILYRLLKPPKLSLQPSRRRHLKYWQHKMLLSIYFDTQFQCKTFTWSVIVALWKFVYNLYCWYLHYSCKCIFIDVPYNLGDWSFTYNSRLFRRSSTRLAGCAAEILFNGVRCWHIYVSTACVASKTMTSHHLLHHLDLSCDAIHWRKSLSLFCSVADCRFGNHQHQLLPSVPRDADRQTPEPRRRNTDTLMDVYQVVPGTGMPFATSILIFRATTCQLIHLPIRLTSLVKEAKVLSEPAMQMVTSTSGMS